MYSLNDISCFSNRPNTILHVEDIMISPPGRSVNLLVTKTSEFFRVLEEKIRPFHATLPDVKINNKLYGQFSAYVKSNGSYNSIMVGELHYKVKTEFYNGNGGIVLDFFGNVSHPVKVKWRDYHFNEKNYIITSHVDTIRSFYCYFNNRSSPANCSKLVR